MTLDFIGYIEEGLERHDFILRVLGPQRDAEGGDFFVELQAPAVLTKTERIFGVDEDQARQLAIRYLMARLDGRLVYDQRGQLVDIHEMLERTG